MRDVVSSCDLMSWTRLRNGTTTREVKILRYSLVRRAAMLYNNLQLYETPLDLFGSCLRHGNDVIESLPIDLATWIC